MTGPSPATRSLVYLRADHRCELCHGSAWGGSVHHRRPRGMGGDRRPETNLPSNLLLLCGSGTTGCHEWVESNRSHATDIGLLIPKMSQQLPAEIPVALLMGTVWLTDDGGYEYGPPGPPVVVDESALYGYAHGPRILDQLRNTNPKESP